MNISNNTISTNSESFENCLNIFQTLYNKRLLLIGLTVAMIICTGLETNMLFGIKNGKVIWLINSHKDKRVQCTCMSMRCLSPLQ